MYPIAAGTTLYVHGFCHLRSACLPSCCCLYSNLSCTCCGCINHPADSRCVGDAPVFQASHVGKVVVAAPAPQHLQSPTAATWAGRVVITGGLGTLGLLTASWLVRQGVQHLVLVSALCCPSCIHGCICSFCNDARKDCMAVSSQCCLAKPTHICGTQDLICSINRHHRGKSQQHAKPAVARICWQSRLLA